MIISERWPQGAFALGPALGLHGLLAIWLSGYVPWQMPTPTPQIAIQADMVPTRQVQDWAERARLAQQQREAAAQRRAAQARERLAAQQAAAQRAAAEQKAQAAQREAARQAAAERTRRAAAAARQLAEQQRQAEVAAKQQAEAAARERAEAARQAAQVAAQRAAEQARQQAEQLARERAEATRQREAAEREQALQAQYAAAQYQAEAVRISQLIQQKVARYWLRPPGISNLTCRVRVRLGATGSVLDVTITKSSGQQSFDQSVEAAVWKADPLPMPETTALRADPRFREHIFIFDPAQHQ